MGSQLLWSSSNWTTAQTTLQFIFLSSDARAGFELQSSSSFAQTLLHWGNSIAGSQRATGQQQWLNKARLCASSTRCPPWPAVQALLIASAHFQNFRECFRELCCKLCLVITDKRKTRGGKMRKPGWHCAPVAQGFRKASCSTDHVPHPCILAAWAP